EVAMAASLPPEDLLRALLPGFRDNPPGYLIAFVGVVPLGLALLAVVRRARELWTWLLLAFAGVALVLAVGSHNPAMPWLFEHVPWLDRFGGPTTWLLLYALAAAGLAGMGAEVVVRGGLWREVGGLGWRLWHNGLWPFLSLAIPAAGLAVAVLVLRHQLALPEPEVQQVWIALALIAFDIIYILPMLRVGPWPGLAVALLVAGEMFLAGARLPAFDTMEASAAAPPATVAGLASDGPRPARVLSQVEAVVAADEGSPAFGTVEANEVLAYGQALLPNLTLGYGLATLEGLEGELLPLASYPRTAALLASVGSGADGLSSALGLSSPLLREGADASRLDVLAALNVGYIIDERDEGDIVVEGARFDMTGEVVVGPGEAVVVERMPQVAADAVALVSYLEEGALDLPQESFVGTVTLTGQDGGRATFLLRTGVDTAVGRYEANEGSVRHQQAPALAEDPKRPGTLLYVALIPASGLVPLRQVRIHNLLDGAGLHVRAMSLLDREGGSSEPVMLDPRVARLDGGRFKVYRLEMARPRAFLVHRYEVVADGAGLMEALP
ncbi:MAG: hypothetical protein ACE5IZ_11315, partial [Dehalococcoidia bacterium]